MSRGYMNQQQKNLGEFQENPELTLSRSNCSDESISSSLSGAALQSLYRPKLRHPAMQSHKILTTPTQPGSDGWPNQWPNSLEDQERDTKSSSNAPVSTSLSDSGDPHKDSIEKYCGYIDSPGSHKIEGHWGHQDAVEDYSNESGDNGTQFTKTDSLPRHRERLSRKKRKKRGSRTKLIYSSSNSSSNSTQGIRPIDKILDGESEKTPIVFSSHEEASLKNIEMMTGTSEIIENRRNVCGSDNYYSSLDNVGTWLALQKFPQSRRPTTLLHQFSQESKYSIRTPHDVVFNVSGQHFIVDTRTLARFPNTMLGSPTKRDRYWDKKRYEYFLDRHRATFEVMLKFYKSEDGILQRPDEIPIDVFIHEIKYYQFDREIITRFLEMEGILRQEKKKELPENPVKQEIWKLFEDPESSTIARLVTSISAIVIAVSVCVFCVETIPSFDSWGHHVNTSLLPSIGNCSNRLSNNSKLFEQPGGLFKLSDHVEKNDKRAKRSTNVPSDSPFSWLELESNPPQVSFYHRVKEEFESTDMPTTSVIDTFDSASVINTLQGMLKECIDTESFNFHKYFLVRCAVELDDGLWYSDTTPIHHILSHIEVHSDDHKHNEEQTASKDTTARLTRKELKLLQRALHLKNVSHPKSIAKLQKNTNTRWRRNTETNITDIQQKLTLNQSAKALLHVCRELDNHSVRSSYAWYVLEAKLDGPAGLLFLIESGCIVWFVIELGLRLVSCPNIRKFCMNFLNIIDTVAIMPYFITLVVTSLHTDSNLRPQTATILRTIRLVRMLRILKLSRHSRGLRILGLTLLRSTRVLVLLVCFQMVLAVTFSSIVYNMEFEHEGSQYESIPDAFWWAIITMTTVGYGDVYPITPLGKLTGAFCAIMGILGIAFPVPVIVSNFNYLYNLDRDDCKLDPEELMEDPMEQEAKMALEKFERFEECLFDAVRKNVGSMSSAPAENASGGQNPADLWNQTRRQYKQTTSAIADKRRRSADNNNSKRLAKGVAAFATASLMSTAMPLKSTTNRSDDRKRKATSI